MKNKHKLAYGWYAYVSTKSEKGRTFDSLFEGVVVDVVRQANYFSVLRANMTSIQEPQQQKSSSE